MTVSCTLPVPLLRSAMPPAAHAAPGRTVLDVPPRSLVALPRTPAATVDGVAVRRTGLSLQQPRRRAA